MKFGRWAQSTIAAALVAVAAAACGGGSPREASPSPASGTGSSTAAPSPATPSAGARGQAPAGSSIDPAKLARMTQIRDQLRERLGAAYDEPVPTVDADALARGRDIYALQCATCHGDTGRGDGMMAAALDPKPADLTNPAEAGFYSDRGLLEIIRHGVPGSMMPPFGQQMKEDELLAVFNYIRTLRGAR